MDYINEARKLLKEIHEIQAANRDNTPMIVGDRVVPWDGSSLTDMNGVDKYIVFEPFTSTKYWIIIAVGQENYTTETLFDPYHQDLIIAHPKTGEKYRVSSNHVKHVNQN